MFGTFQNSDKFFVTAFRNLQETAAELATSETNPVIAADFIKQWHKLAAQTVLTNNLYCLRLLLNSLTNLVKLYPQWQMLVARYSGWLYLINCDYQRATSNFEEELELAREAQDFDAVAQALLNLAEVTLIQSHFSQVENLLWEALDLSYIHDLVVRQIQSLNRLGRLYNQQHRLSSSQPCLEQALNLIASTKWPDGIAPLEVTLEEAFSHLWLGANFAELRHWTEAEQDLYQSMRLSYNQHNLAGVVEAMLKLGAVYDEIGQYDSAMICFEGSLATCEQLHYLPALLRAYYYKALAHRRMGRFRDALVPAQRAVEIGLEIEQNEWLARAFFNLAEVYREIGDTKLALACNLRALELFRPADTQAFWIEILVGVGNFLLSLRDQPEYWEQALDCYRKSLPLIEANEQLEYMALVLGRMGRAFMKVEGLNGLEDAARCYRLQLRLAGNLDSTELKMVDAVAVRVEALTGLQSCAGLNRNRRLWTNYTFKNDEVLRQTA